MKILIFGASGYLAKFVISRLEKDGHEVIPVFRRSNVETLPRSQGINLEDDFRNLRQLMVEQNPEIAINMTNFFTKNSDLEDISRLSKINCEFISELSFACLESQTVFFQVGSAWQADFKGNDPSSQNLYALFKGLASQIIRWFQYSFDLKVFQLNLFDTYGPNDSRGKVVQFLLDQIDNLEPVDLSGGEQILELVHVDDVASAISAGINRIESLLKSGDSFKNEPTYWCYPKTPVKLREIVDQINHLVESPLKINWGARQYRVGEIFERDGELREVIPGWAPVTSLNEGLRSSIFSD